MEHFREKRRMKWIAPSFVVLLSFGCCMDGVSAAAGSKMVVVRSISELTCLVHELNMNMNYNCSGHRTPCPLPSCSLNKCTTFVHVLRSDGAPVVAATSSLPNKCLDTPRLPPKQTRKYTLRMSGQQRRTCLYQRWRLQNLNLSKKNGENLHFALCCVCCLVALGRARASTALHIRV